MEFIKVIEASESLENAVYAVAIDSKKESEASSLTRKSKSIFLTLIAKRHKLNKPLEIDKLAFELLNNAIEYVNWVTSDKGEFIPTYPKE